MLSWLYNQLSESQYFRSFFLSTNHATFRGKQPIVANSILDYRSRAIGYSRRYSATIIPLYVRRNRPCREPRPPLVVDSSAINPLFRCYNANCHKLCLCSPATMPISITLSLFHRHDTLNAFHFYNRDLRHITNKA